MSEKLNQIKGDKNFEIDLIEVFFKIWGGRRIIYKSIALSLIIGIVIIIGNPKEYKSEVILLVESSSSSNINSLLQQFGGIVGLGGINQVTQRDALTPELYPDIIQSTPFLLEMLNVKITASKYDSALLVSEHLNRHCRKSVGKLIMENTLGLPHKILKAIKGPPKVKVDSAILDNSLPIKLTPGQNRVIRELSKRIKATEGASNNTLIISAEMQDPLLAAELADSLVKCLTGYIIEYRTQKVKTDLQFIEMNLKKAEEEYNKAQRDLAFFQDQNQNIITSSGKIIEQNLQSQYTLAFNVYNTLAQQREQAKIRVQENTPVFKVMEPAKVPLSKNRPQINLILIAMVFLGGFVGIVIILSKMALHALKNK